ncbi:MAG: hypothetical protein ABJ092_08535 [Gillisia sp.]
MKLFKYKCLLILFVLILTSCEQEDHFEEVNESGAQMENIFSNKYKLLNITPNIYHSYFQKTDNTLGISALKYHGNPNYSFVEKIDGNSNNKAFFLNQKSRKIDHFDPTEIYGKTMDLKFNKKSTKDTIHKSFYIPKKLIISKTIQQTETKISILAYYKSFLLEWNADPKNGEGLILAVEYLGESLSNEGSNENLNVVNVDYIENDNGKYILNEAMFDNIPNLSFINIILLRGNVDISEIEGESYKTYVESHERIPVLLVKDLNSVKGLNE